MVLKFQLFHAIGGIKLMAENSFSVKKMSEFFFVLKCLKKFVRNKFCHKFSGRNGDPLNPAPGRVADGSGLRSAAQVDVVEHARRRHRRLRP
jgi:hypothetical protein